MAKPSPSPGQASSSSTRRARAISPLYLPISSLYLPISPLYLPGIFVFDKEGGCVHRFDSKQLKEVDAAITALV